MELSAAAFVEPLRKAHAEGGYAQVGVPIGTGSSAVVPPGG